MSRRGATRREEGVILVVVLLVLTAAVAVALGLGREVRVEVAVARARADEVLLRAMADTVLERVKAELRRDDTPADTLFDLWRDDEAAFAGAALGAEEAPGRSWLLLPEEDPGDGRELRYGIRDEASRLDVNVATREQLLALPGITEEAVDGILDWRDEDDEVSELGAESAYYLSLDPPYRAKNAAFESLDELLRVRGIDPLMLYGEDRNRNGLLDPGEDDGDRSFPPDDADGVLDRGLVDYLTVFARDLDRTADGRERLRWQDADADALGERLGQAGLPDDAVNRLQATHQMAGDAGTRAEVLGRYFAIGGRPDPAEVAIILDEVTTAEGEAVPGRINVNTAARPVLQGLFEAEEVEAILTRRLDPSLDMSTPAWLLEVVEPGRFLEVVDRVTGRSWQFTVDATVLMDDRPRFQRFEALLDRSFAPVRVLTWRDTTARGFPIPGERGEELP